MAMDKVNRMILQRLERIEAKLDRLTGEAAPTPPWPGYDEATVNDVVARLDSLTDAERAQVLAYERSHKNRSGIITPLVNWNS